MEITFYIAAVIAVLSTLRVITHHDAVHALLYLIVSLLAIAVVFYALGAPFAAALEVIVYAGAIVVLFVFAVMMLDINADTMRQEKRWLRPQIWLGPAILAVILLAILAYTLWAGPAMGNIDGMTVSSQAVGKALFGPYILVVELASFLLLSALVAAAHIARD